MRQQPARQDTWRVVTRGHVQQGGTVPHGSVREKDTRETPHDGEEDIAHKKTAPTDVEAVCMVRPRGFEPLTTWFVARYSIQLSYTRTVFYL